MDINKAKTKSVYKNIKDEEICDCIYCNFFIDNIKKEKPKLNNYLDSLGISIEKPFEISLPYINEKGDLDYPFSQYIAFGKCEEGFKEELGDISVVLANSHPSTNINEEHFVIEIFPIIFNKDILTDEITSEL